jgi:peptide/nickel transport system permease protein
VGLTNYVLKRLLLVVPVLFGISIGVFLLIKLTPGDTVDALLPPAQQSPTRVAQVTRKYGLDEPIYVQYGRWLADALQGDLGRSYTMGRPVAEAVATSSWATLQLAVAALAFALLVAVPLGIVGATYKGSWIDQTSRLVAFGGISMPAFWVGIMAILVFSLWWQSWYGRVLIPAGGYVPITEGLVPWVRHVTAPAITLGIGFAAILTRQVRSAMVEVLEADYVRTARAKGVRERAVVLVHALRNGLIPVVTVLGLQIGFLMNGAVVVEQVFQWPGIGRLMFQAVTSRDMPLIQGVVLFIATVFVTTNLVVDVVYSVLDPRVDY